MSLVRRIELVNFLDSDGGIHWRPDFKKTVLNLNKYSSAIVMENGTGKTSIVDAVLAILSRDNHLITNTKGKMPPVNSGPWGHVRIEFIIPMPSSPGQASMLDDDVIGDGLNTWVFGMCGHCKGKHYFYCYRGLLEDSSPVEEEPHQTTFYPNETFKAKLKNAKKSEWDVSEDTWRNRISKHIPRQQVLQMLTFQKGGAGDESRPLFPLKRGDQDYDIAFFYKFVAPELMSGVMVADNGSDVRFEDVINRSANRIVAAQENVYRDERDINNKRLAISNMQGLLREADRVGEAKALVAKAKQDILNVATAVDYLETADLPGLPQFVATGNKQVDELVSHMAIVPGHGLMLKDEGFAAFLGKESKHLNEKAEAEPEKCPPIVSEQPIEITPDLKNFSDGRGRHRKYPYKFYSLKNCIAFIRKASNVYLDLLPNDESGRQAILDLLDRAFTHASKTVDTSPFRVIGRQVSASMDKRAKHLLHLEEHRGKVKKSIEAIGQALAEIDHLEKAYQTLVDTGILQQEEAPREAMARIKNQVNELEKQARALIAQQTNYDGNKKQYDLLLEEHGEGADPEAVQIDLINNRNEVQAQKKRLETARANNRQKRDKAEEDLRTTKDRIFNLTPLVDRLKNGNVAAKSILAQFSNCSTPEEVRKQVKTLRSKIDSRITSLSDELKTIAEEIAKKETDLGEEVDKVLEHKGQTEGRLESLNKVVAALRNEAKGVGDMIDTFKRQQVDRGKELKKAKLSLVKIRETERTLQEMADKVTEFQKISPDDSPEQFINKAEAQLNLFKTESEQISERARLLEEEKSALENKRVAPEAVARQAWDIVPSGARNLWEVVMDDIPPARQQELLDKLSALIFSPVVKTEQEASTLAKRFEEEHFPLPVFMEDQLIESLQTNDFGLVRALPLYRSAQVDFLLHPEKTKARIEAIEKSLVQLSERQKEIDLLSRPLKNDAPQMVLARSALDAIRADAPNRLVSIREDITGLSQAVEDLQEIITDIASKIEIHSQSKRLKEKEADNQERSRTTIEEAIKSLEEAVQKLRIERSNLKTLYKRDARQALEDKLEEANGELIRFEKKYGPDSHFSKDISSYEEYHSLGGEIRLSRENDSFVRAEKLRVELTTYAEKLFKARDNLRNKQEEVDDALLEWEKKLNQFDFSALIQFHKTGGLREYQKIQSQIQKLDDEKDGLTRVLEEHDFSAAQIYTEKKDEQARLSRESAEKKLEYEEADKSIEAALKSQNEDDKYLDRIHQEEKRYDEQLADLLPLLRQAPALGEGELKTVKDNRLLDKVSACTDAILDCFSDSSTVTGEATGLVREVRDLLMNSGLVNLSKDLQDGQKKVKRAQRNYESAMEDTLPSLRDKFTDYEISEVANTRDDPQKLKEQVARYEMILNRKELEKDSHKDIVEKEKNGFIERMSSAASSAADNLKAFRSVCSKHKDATFEVSAEIATTADISEAMKEIIKLVENTHKRQRETGGKASSKSLDAEYFGAKNSEQRVLSAKVLYEAIYKEPSIKVRHPDIRQGKTMEFSQGDKTISKGQKAALDLMMLVRLAEFAKNKQLAAMTAGNRNRETGLQQTFILIDGLFSNLSKQSLIKGALAALAACKGQFQLIGFIHNLRYINDFNIFPTYIVGRKVEGRSTINGEALSESWVEIDDKDDPNYTVPNGGSKIGQVGMFNSTFVPKDAEGLPS